jgi:hypothetical protein
VAGNVDRPVGPSFACVGERPVLNIGDDDLARAGAAAANVSSTPIGPAPIASTRAPYTGASPTECGVTASGSANAPAAEFGWQGNGVFGAADEVLGELALNMWRAHSRSEEPHIRTVNRLTRTAE